MNLKQDNLQKKYNLLTSYCGYPKETKIAFELENIFGENIINQIAFSKTNEEIKKILDTVSLSVYPFYTKLEEIMENEFYNKYMKYKFPGLLGPLKKTKKYNSINYKEAYKLINEYKKIFKKNERTLNNKIENKEHISNVLTSNTYINEQKPKQK